MKFCSFQMERLKNHRFLNNIVDALIQQHNNNKKLREGIFSFNYCLDSFCPLFSDS